MKYLVVIVVVGLLLWLMFGRGRRASEIKRKKDSATAAPVAMLACAHCGVHLPQTDALFDTGGRPYCGEPHRLAGPR